MRKNTMTRIFGYLAVAAMTLGFAGITYAEDKTVVTPETEVVSLTSHNSIERFR